MKKKIKMLKGKVKDVFIWRRWGTIMELEDEEREEGDKDAV